MKKKKGGLIKWIVIIVVILGVIGGIFGDKKTSNKDDSKADTNENTEDTSPVANVNEELDEFTYTIEENCIKLEDYSGTLESLLIDRTYTVDTQEYIVNDLLDFRVKSGVKTLIISEGITEINNIIFNGSDITTLYLPKSLTRIEDDTLAYLNEDGINLYYGGTEEEWNKILVAHEEKSVSEELKDGNPGNAGAALADKLNSLVGHEYDASKFTFHYDSNPEDIE